MKFHDEGIWFEEEDPTSEYYRPECCTNVYLDHAKGKFDKLAKKYQYDEYDEYDYEYDDTYDAYNDQYQVDGYIWQKKQFLSF